MRITKRSAYSALAGIGILMGAAGVTAAATGNDTSPDPAAVAQPSGQATPADDESTEDPADEAGGEANEHRDADGQDADGQDADGDHEGRDEHADGPETPPAYTSSVQTTPEDGSSEASEADAEAALAALATVTPDEATAMALAAEPGTVDDVELSNEAGNVVYEVEIVTDAGVEMEVVVDAGNGEVLAVLAD